MICGFQLGDLLIRALMVGGVAPILSYGSSDTGGGGKSDSDSNDSKNEKSEK